MRWFKIIIIISFPSPIGPLRSQSQTRALSVLPHRPHHPARSSYPTSALLPARPSDPSSPAFSRQRRAHRNPGEEPEGAGAVDSELCVKRSSRKAAAGSAGEHACGECDVAADGPSRGGGMARRRCRWWRMRVVMNSTTGR